jgi:hypothetical protein
MYFDTALGVQFRSLREHFSMAFPTYTNPVFGDRKSNKSASLNRSYRKRPARCLCKWCLRVLPISIYLFPGVISALGDWPPGGPLKAAISLVRCGRDALTSFLLLITQPSTSNSHLQNAACVVRAQGCLAPQHYASDRHDAEQQLLDADGARDLDKYCRPAHAGGRLSTSSSANPSN